MNLKGDINIAQEKQGQYKVAGYIYYKKKLVNKNTFMINVLIMAIIRFWKY